MIIFNRVYTHKIGTTIKMQNIFSTLQVSSCPCAAHPSFHPLPGKTWMFFLSPHISLRFLEFHVNGIIQYVLSSLNWLITYQPLTFFFHFAKQFYNSPSLLLWRCCKSTQAPSSEHCRTCKWTCSCLIQRGAWAPAQGTSCFHTV